MEVPLNEWPSHITVLVFLMTVWFNNKFLRKRLWVHNMLNMLKVNKPMGSHGCINWLKWAPAAHFTTHIFT